MRELIKDILNPRYIPWLYLLVAFSAVLPTAWPELRPYLIYNRIDISHGELWRIWTGHLVHFGWPHYLADGALFIVIGWAFQQSQPSFSRVSLLILPAVVSASIFWFDPAMNIYGGLSGINVGLLVFLACQGWQRNWMDWFWPAILGVHVIEVLLEIRNRGVGGGAIRFDDATIHVATIAHIGGAVYGVTTWGILALLARKTKHPTK